MSELFRQQERVLLKSHPAFCHSPQKWDPSVGPHRWMPASERVTGAPIVRVEPPKVERGHVLKKRETKRRLRA
jgi:hypothetical protein